MSQKLKYNEEKDRYRLHLTHDELVLIAKMVSHIRLGTDDKYSEAAFGIGNAISEFDCGIDDEAMSDITFRVGVENADGDDYVVVLNGEDCVIDVAEVY